MPRAARDRATSQLAIAQQKDGKSSKLPDIMMSNRGASESTNNAPVRLKKPSSRASLLQDLALDSALRIGKANLKSNRPLNRNNILMANHNENMMLNLGPTLLNEPSSLKYEGSLHLQKQ